MQRIPRPLVSITLNLGSILLCTGLAACGGSSSSSSASSSTPLSLATATAALQQKITTETPHVVSSSVVTELMPRNFLPAGWFNLFPEAAAADLSLSTIWDPESGSAPQGSDFAMLNLYLGGGFSCDSSTNTCTNGTITVPNLESLKDYMGQALSPTFQNSNGASVTLFGRLQTTSMLLCAMGQLVPADDVDTDGLPKVGTLTLVFPTDTSNTLYQPQASGGCGASPQSAGRSVSGTVTAVTSANYAKEITMSMGNSIDVWLKLDSTAGVFNMMSLEDQRPSGRYAVDRTIANITGLNTSGASTVLFEYISMGSASSDSTSCYSNGHWSCSFEYHRVAIDEAANTAYLVSNDGDPGDSAGGTGAPQFYDQFTGAAEPSVLNSCAAGSSCSGTLALSFTADGENTPSGGFYSSAGNDYNGCINIDSRAIATDDTLGCDLTGASILASGGASTMIEATREVYISDVVATLLGNTTASTTLAFTGASDIYTAPNTR